MILKKYFLVLKTILKAKYIFHAPTQKDLLIFDGESLHELKINNLRYSLIEEELSELKEALDNNMFNESSKDGRYVKYDSQRKSNVTFGKK